MSRQIKQIAAIHDMSGFGRCSLTVAIPVLSSMGHQCCPLPTAYFSAHTGFSNFTLHDMTSQMIPALEHWAELGIEFDAIYSGFLASESQMDIVARAKEMFPKALLIVDPVMGDDGKPYKTYTEKMCANMSKLAFKADVITPNITEASIMLGKSPDSAPASPGEALEWIHRLSEDGKRRVVMTGLFFSEGEISSCWTDGKNEGVITMPFVGMQYHGTGDLFASVLTGEILSGKTFEASARRAAAFVRDCAAISWEDGTPANFGVRFESLLHTLAAG